ncbi:MAG: 50S ribosomal protein L3, partial [Candidatus Cloacimonetes bacterium]|nr:50S ribosomal protein L3 [Candidatus Cloacimonadota bacterium]
MLGIIGKKIGMTRIFDEMGESIPVTIISAGPCTVVQQKSEKKEEYNAIQIGLEEIKEKKLTKPLKGHFEKNGKKYFRFLKEFRVDKKELMKYKVGSDIKSNIFEKNEIVNVTGISKGKGFAGVMKRYNFHGKSRTHGTHESFRGGGSIGQSATPSRGVRGEKKPGQMGKEKETDRNLIVVKIDEKRNLIMI